MQRKRTEMESVDISESKVKSNAKGNEDFRRVVRFVVGVVMVV